MRTKLCMAELFETNLGYTISKAFFAKQHEFWKYLGKKKIKSNLFSYVACFLELEFAKTQISLGTRV